MNKKEWVIVIFLMIGVAVVVSVISSFAIYILISQKDINGQPSLTESKANRLIDNKLDDYYTSQEVDKKLIIFQNTKKKI